MKRQSSGAIKIDEKEIRTHHDGLIRQSVEDTLNALLNAEADAIGQASRYLYLPDRQDMRAGIYKRKHLTKAGEVELRIPRLRTFPFEMQISDKCLGLYEISGDFSPRPNGNAASFTGI